MQNSDPLIRTKLRLPYIRPGLVSRPRLQEKIAQGLRCPLTLITAPAGFGKTTLVASYIVRCGMPVAWLSLDKHDNQDGRFLTYLIAALQVADPRIGNDAAQLAAGIRQAPSEAILTSLINDLDSTNTDIVLVLDDYHLISSQAVHEHIAFLLNHQPGILHLVITTRSDPPLPVTRLRARGQTVELRGADLRFTEPEAAQFLNEVMSLHLDEGSIAMLEARTEGWIAGLQMASLALQGSLAGQGSLAPQGSLSMSDQQNDRRFIDGFSGTNRYILDYLLEEVMANQPPDIQHFLLCTSILERMTAPLCDALLASDERPESGKENRELPSGSMPPLPQSASILKYLEGENLFLVSLDNGNTSEAGTAWFRYHHLFSDLLRARLNQAQPTAVPRLHLRASAWFEQNGYIHEAIQHRFAAHAFDQAADLIERYGPAYFAESDPSVLLLAEFLPQEMILTRPKIGLYQAWLLIIQGRIEKARPLLNDLGMQLAGIPPSAGQRWMQTVVASAQAFLSSPASNPNCVPLPDYLLLEEVPAEEPILRNAADFLYGMALARREEFDRAVEIAQRCIQREKEARRAQAVPTVVPFLTRIYLMQGRLHASASLCREYLDPLKERGIRFVYTNSSMLIDLGEVLCEWNCLEEAEQYIRNGLQINEPWRNIMTDGFGLVALTRLLMAKGNYAGAIEVVEKFEKRLLQHSRPREFDEDLHTLKIRVQLASGDLRNPSQWANQIVLTEDFRLHPEYYQLTLSRIRLAQGRYTDVEEMLTGMTPQASAGSQITRQIECNLLLAAATAGQHRLPEALTLIKTCLAMAEPEGYIQIFLDVGEPVREILAAYLRSDVPDHKLFAQKVLDAFPPPNQVGSPGLQSAGLIEPLSERELEVLHLIALGMTNQEIATQLIVALGTIKAHAASIYRKLDVANRTEAVARARQLSILPS